MVKRDNTEISKDIDDDECVIYGEENLNFKKRGFGNAVAALVGAGAADDIDAINNISYKSRSDYILLRISKFDDTDIGKQFIFLIKAINVHTNIQMLKTCFEKLTDQKYARYGSYQTVIEIVKKLKNNKDLVVSIVGMLQNFFTIENNIIKYAALYDFILEDGNSEELLKKVCTYATPEWIMKHFKKISDILKRPVDMLMYVIPNVPTILHEQVVEYIKTILHTHDYRVYELITRLLKNKVSLELDGLLDSIKVEEKMSLTFLRNITDIIKTYKNQEFWNKFIVALKDIDVEDARFGILLDVMNDVFVSDKLIGEDFKKKCIAELNEKWKKHEMIEEIITIKMLNLNSIMGGYVTIPSIGVLYMSSEHKVAIVKNLRDSKGVLFVSKCMMETDENLAMECLRFVKRVPVETMVDYGILKNVIRYGHYAMLKHNFEMIKLVSECLCKFSNIHEQQILDSLKQYSTRAVMDSQVEVKRAIDICIEKCSRP